MHGPPEQKLRVAAADGPPAACAYCGGRLDGRYYFCPTCATPYTSVESVLPPLRPARLTEGELVAKKAPHVVPLFWTYFAVVVVTGVACYVLFRSRRVGLALLLQSLALLVTTSVFASIHWRALLVQLRRVGFVHPAAWIALLALGPLLGVNYVYHGWLMEQLGVENSPPLQELRSSGLGGAALVFLMCVLPGLTEEIAFRGLVQHWLQVALTPLKAMVLASALFTALHFSVVSAPYLFGVGMLLGWAKYKTGSLYPSMLLHFLHNYVVLEFFWRS